MFDISKIAKAIHDNAVNHGFWDKYLILSWKQRFQAFFVGKIKKDREVPEILCLIHDEVSEALRAYAKGQMEHFGEELADIVIRVFDAAEGLGVDIEREIYNKHKKNIDRPKMHGKKI